MSEADRRGGTPRRPRWLAPALLLAGLLPTLSLGWQALSLGTSAAQQPPGEGEGEPEEADGESGGIADLASDTEDPMRKVLRQIPKDSAVLVNVTARDMPSTPDILNLGKRSTTALERCLADNVDTGVRMRCAVVLESLGDRRALPTLQAAIEDWDPWVRYRVVRALRAMPDASSVEPLLKLYARRDEEPHIRYGVIDALGAMSDKRAVQVLREGLKKKPESERKADERSAHFTALWASRHLMARGTLEGDLRYCLESDDDRLVLEATEAAAEFRSPRLVASLIPLVEHPSVEVRNKAVFALGKIGDKTATAALLAHLPKVREARMLNNIAFALERLDREAFYKSIAETMAHKQAIIRLNAAFVLGDVKHAEGRALLEKALDDPSDFVRTSAIAALGKLGVAEAIPAVERFVGAAQLGVREEAIYALDKLTKGGRADLVHDKLFKIDEPEEHGAVVHRAAVALARAGDVRAEDYLVRCMENGECAVRVVREFLTRHADEQLLERVLVAWTKGRRDLTWLLAERKPAGALPAASGVLGWAWAHEIYDDAKSAMDLLGSLGAPASVAALAPRTKSDDTFVRLHAATAMARLGDAGAAALLTAELDNLAAERMPVFARIVGRIGEAEPRAKLDPSFAERQALPDVPTALAAAAVRLRWDPEQAAFRFLDALASPRGFERDLAELYLRRVRDDKLTWVLRRMLSREGREDTRDRLRVLLDKRG
ncbi:MAG: HEAT repeat domain-containing protein [Myxococcales bacterium]|nr:HEAT repeat domain-containing protein [Myxococcales bacterium]